MPRARQTAAATIAQKAWAAGFSGVQVDGNDVIAMRHETECALTRARAGNGPTLLEAQTYRLADHTTADDASRYRDKAEVETRLAAEPLGRLRLYLTSISAWSKADETALKRACDSEIDAAVAAYLATPPQAPETMVDHLFATLPADLAAQRAAIMVAGDGDG